MKLLTIFLLIFTCGCGVSHQEMKQEIARENLIMFFQQMDENNILSNWIADLEHRIDRNKKQIDSLKIEIEKLNQKYK